MNDDGRRNVMDSTQALDAAAALARIRGSLVDAVAADLSRPSRRRRAPVATLAAAISILAVGGAIAADPHFFAAAPSAVKDAFGTLADRTGAEVDPSGAVRIGVIDDHVVFAAPTAGGGFCLRVGASSRSGPTGGFCLPDDPRQGEIALNVSSGSDGGFVFGRVSAEGATTVDVELSGRATLTTPVRENGFFLVALPAGLLPAVSRGELRVSATARDAAAAAVARSSNGVPAGGDTDARASTDRLPIPAP